MSEELNPRNESEPEKSIASIENSVSNSDNLDDNSDEIIDISEMPPEFNCFVFLE